MIVFKAYLRIVKKMLPMLLIYVTIFLFFAIAITTIGSSNNFTSKKPNVYLVNHDLSPISERFTEYVQEKSVIISLKDDDESLKDALFFRIVDLIIIVPEHFVTNLTYETPLKIVTMKVPDSYTSIYAEMMFNTFWQSAEAYLKAGLDETAISNLILADLEGKVNVKLANTHGDELAKVSAFYNFTNYIFIALNILCIGLIISIFDNMHVKKRIISSSLSARKINLQLLLGNITVNLVTWLSIAAISLILFQGVMFSYNGLWFLLYSFVFSLMCLFLSYLIGNLVKNKEAQNGIVNILALGTSFLCGAFVPQSMLGETVINISKILPSYWYISGNNIIADTTTFTLATTNRLLLGLGIMLAFSFIIHLVTSIITQRNYKKVKL